MDWVILPETATLETVEARIVIEATRERVKQSLKGDPRDLPAYTYVEAGKALGIPPTTIGAWVRGQEYKRKVDTAFFEPVIVRPDPKDTRLSFKNLVEAFVLRSLRTAEDEVSLSAVRVALEIAQQEYGIDRLLIHEDLRTSAGELFLDQYERLLTLSRSQQYVMRQMFKDYLRRVEYDERNLPKQLFPVGGQGLQEKIISISPFISFGRPVIARRRVSTSAIRQRIDAGESPDHVAKDYKLNRLEVDTAIRYEVGVAA